MSTTINEKALLERLDEYKQEHSSAFYDKEITDEQMLSSLKEHIEFDNVITILLRGSRATGRNNPYSDVDIVVIKEKNSYQTITFKDINGVRYNIKICNKNFFDNEHMLRFHYGMRILYGNKEIGEEIINKIQKYEEETCNSIVKKCPDHKKYLYELLEFIDDKDPITSAFAKAKLLSEYPAYLAHYNGFNLIGFKTIIDCLIRDNYPLACVYLKALNKKSTKEDLKELVDKSFDELCGINILDRNFKNCKKANDIGIYKLYNDYSCFLELIDSLKPKDMLGIDFLLECNKKAPKLFNELWSFIN